MCFMTQKNMLCSWKKHKNSLTVKVNLTVSRSKPHVTTNVLVSKVGVSDIDRESCNFIILTTTVSSPTYFTNRPVVEKCYR